MNQVKTILFDIDGTIATIQHRRSFLASENPDWKSFNAKMGQDTPSPAIAELYKTLWESGKYELILITGRTEEYRKLTEQWLLWNKLPFDIIKMRKDGDFRADHLIKEEILKELQASKKEILFVVDDRKQVVDMWRRNGIVCLQCAEGNF